MRIWKILGGATVAPKKEPVLKRLVHFSKTAGLSEVDPARMGEGYANPNDVAGLRKSFFYLEGAETESKISNRQFVYATGEVDMNELYDVGKDPDGILTDEVKKDGVPAIEKAVKGTGFKGYYNSESGFDAVALFDKVPVTEIAHPGMPNKRIPRPRATISERPLNVAADEGTTTAAVEARTHRECPRCSGTGVEAVYDFLVEKEVQIACSRCQGTGRRNSN